MAIARFTLVALDCPDPAALAEFYRSIVGGRIRLETATDEWVRLQTDSGCDLGFQRVDDYQPPDWPFGAAQQAHLDFDVSDLAAGERAVTALGAVRAAVQPSPQEWLVFIDPAGHPFCLIKR